MNRPTNYRTLLVRSLAALAIGLLAVTVCYFYVDRPVAFYVYRSELPKIAIFKWLTFPPPELQTVSPLIIAVLMVRRAWGPLRHCEQTLLVACLSLIVADEFRVSLGSLLGRYWPETWQTPPNLSLIGTGTYGFHPFQWNDDLGSFPSGHATRILSFAAVWWLAVPRSRVVCLVVCPPLLASLVFMDYHFVSDVIAGGTLGGIVAVYAARLSQLGPAKSDAPAAGLAPNEPPPK